MLYVVTPTLPGRLAWLADDVDQFRHLAVEDFNPDHMLLALRSISYAVDSRGHATSAQRR